MDTLNQAIAESKNGIGKSTQQKQNSAWNKWQKFITRANLGGCLLERKTRLEQNGIVAAFAYAIRHNQFGSTTQTTLRGETVRATIAQVAKTFRTHGVADPSIDASGRRYFVIERLLKGFTDDDPAITRQPALPLVVFRSLLHNATSELDKAVGALAGGALFFGMRSCEYLTVPGQKHRRTKKLRLRNIVFRKNGRTINQHAALEKLSSAQTVSITFENQKNGEKMETVTQFRTDIDICPVRMWATTVHRIRSYPDSTSSTPIDAFRTNNKTFAISGDVMRTYLRRTVERIGPDRLGIKTSTVGTHSIRASFAMMMLLNHVEDSILMKKGRWKSAAFLAYIRAQINAFGYDTSKRMVHKISDNFYVIPQITNIKLDS